MSVLTYVSGLWKARQRQLDIKILWPACKKQADSIEKARRVFLYHALSDSAWSVFTDQEIINIIGNLE
jgi:hypothetical protein